MGAGMNVVRPGQQPAGSLTPDTVSAVGKLDYGLKKKLWCTSGSDDNDDDDIDDIKAISEPGAWIDFQASF